MRCLVGTHRAMLVVLFWDFILVLWDFIIGLWVVRFYVFLDLLFVDCWIIRILDLGSLDLRIVGGTRMQSESFNQPRYTFCVCFCFRQFAFNDWHRV